MDTMAKDLMFQILCSTSTQNAPGIIPNTSNYYLFMCFRASYSTHRFHNSCSIEPLSQHKHKNTHVLQSLLLNANIKYSCVPELIAQEKTSNTHVLQSFSLNTKHQILMYLIGCAQDKHLINYLRQGPRPTHEIIYIKHMQMAYTQCIKQIIMFMCSGVLCLI